MFFGRIYSKGKPFQPSWRSFAGYAGMIALILLAVEFNVLNVFPGNKMGQVLLAVPAFYFAIAAIFLVNDGFWAVWRFFRGGRKVRKRR
jgi:hypothetical protein